MRAIALDIDSFGGEVAGAFDLADRIRAARAQKPVWAFVAEHACPRATRWPVQADRIMLPRTGAVGSIGVVTLHTDMSGALDQEGIAVTLIHAGQHKIDANPYRPLPEAVRRPDAARDGGRPLPLCRNRRRRARGIVSARTPPLPRKLPCFEARMP